MGVQQTTISATAAIRILWPEVAPEEQDAIDPETALIAEQKAKIFRLYTRGMSCRAVAEELAREYSKGGQVEPRHYSTISRYIREIHDNYRLIALQDAAIHIASQLAKLDLMEKELWLAWDRSTGELVETTTGRRQTSSNSFDSAVVKKKQREGNPKIMALIQGCWDRRSKLTGIMNEKDFNSMTGLPPVKMVAGIDPLEAV